MNPLSLLFPLAAAAAAAPTPPTPPTPPAPVANAPTSSEWKFKTGSSEIEIQTEGNVTFAPDSDAIFDLHGDGVLRVRERDGKDVRTLTASKTGIVWQVNGATRPFDAAGKTWLRKIVKARPATPTPPPPPPRK
jgi:hypothetical protein